MTNVIEAVNSFLENYNLKDKLLCLGFSGGYDSMCLLHVLKSLHCKVIAVHLNHNWRGEESLMEQDNCRIFCETYGIQFYSEILSDSVPHSETAARDARYEFFNKCMDTFKADAFLTAHNADDNAETVLYRIIKGTGVDGLCAIAPQRDFFYRPLLRVRRTDIEKYCADYNLSPNVDSSNVDIKYKRNLIRHEILPLLNKINPDAVEALNSLSELAKQDVEALNIYNSCCRTSDFVNYPQAIQARIVKNLLITNSVDYDRDFIELLVNFIIINSGSKSGKVCSVSKDLWLYVNCNEFYITKTEERFLTEVEVKNEGRYSFGDYIFTLEPCTSHPTCFPADKDCIAYVNLRNIDFTLRTRRDGDVISPLGSGGSQKLKKYLNEKKIPAHIKDKIVLLCCGNDVLWAAGYGMSDKIKVIDNKVTHVLKLQKKGGYNES